MEESYVYGNKDERGNREGFPLNRSKASAWFIFVVLFIGIVFSPKVATVRGQFEEGTFSATEGESFTWKCNESKVEYYSTGDLINVSLGREKTGTHGGLPCKVIRFSEWVRNASGRWTRTANDAVFMARNGSEGYLEAQIGRASCRERVYCEV